jgi:transporter family-2 protein
MGIVWAIFSGTLMAVQGAMNATLGRVMGLLWMLASVYVIGSAVAIAAALIFSSQPLQISRTGLYVWLSGPAGLAITLLVAAAVPKLGMVRTTTFIVVAQVLTAAAIDLLGLLGVRQEPFAPWRLLGVAALALGAYLLLRPAPRA